MDIRCATEADVQVIFELLIELRRSGYQEMGEPVQNISPGEKALEKFRKLIKREDIHIFLAEESDKTVALAVVYELVKILDGKTRFLVEEMVVDPMWRGKGVGSRLLEHIEKFASKKGITIIKITTGTKLKANDFYRKHGYIHFENAYRKKLDIIGK